VRTCLTTLALATLLSLPAWAVPALADQGRGSGTAPGSGSAHSLLSAAPGSEGSGSGSGGSEPRSGESVSGSGGPGSDDSGSATGTSPRHSDPSQHSDSRPGLRAGPEPASQAGASAAEPAAPAATSAAEPTAPARPSTGGPDTARAQAAAAASRPPVGSAAGRRAGFPRLSTPPSFVAVGGVAGGALLFVAMVTAGFRARARLGRLG
jgi:hypothetical protein